MGTSAGGIIIQKTSKRISESIVLVFGDNFKKTSYCDCRKSNCIYAGRIDDKLALINSDLAERFFSIEHIDEKLFAFFDKPNMIFAFEEYDSGACYGYAIFKNGKLERKLRANNYNDITVEYGSPDDDELEWINGTEIEDSDNSKLLKNSTNGHEIPMEFKYKAILQLIMQKKFGFNCETMDDVFSETGHFINESEFLQKNVALTENKNVTINATSNKWWKFGKK